MAEGTQFGGWQTIMGANLGVVFILLSQKFIDRYDIQFGRIRGITARRMVLMVGVMTIHSFSEGVAVGASFGGGMTLALVITAAIAVHNIPEGLAISAVLRPRGVSVLGCAWWSVFSSLPQPLMAVPAFLFIEAFRPALPLRYRVCRGGDGVHGPGRTATRGLRTGAKAGRRAAGEPHDRRYDALSAIPVRSGPAFVTR